MEAPRSEFTFNATVMAVVRPATLTATDAAVGCALAGADQYRASSVCGKRIAIGTPPAETWARPFSCGALTTL